MVALTAPREDLILLLDVGALGDGAAHWSSSFSFPSSDSLPILLGSVERANNCVMFSHLLS